MRVCMCIYIYIVYMYSHTLLCYLGDNQQWKYNSDYQLLQDDLCLSIVEEGAAPAVHADKCDENSELQVKSLHVFSSNYTGLKLWS